MSTTRLTAIRAVLLASALTPGEAHAGWFKGIPILEEVEEEVTKGAEQLGDILQKGLNELGNGAKVVTEEAEKLIAKAFREVGSAGEHLFVLVTEGKCGGDICKALDATVEMVEANFKDAGQALKDAEIRLREGKPLDALWHLSVAPIDIQQENAAKAAMKSSVLRAVGQVAASAYGGPYGAAAYAAWLTYHSTGGDIELALKAGAIAGVTAAATSALAKDVEFVDFIEGVKADEIIQRAISSGAIAGVAVALSGGTQTEIEQAFTRGAVSSVVRDTYREMTKSHLEDNLKPSTGEAYCLAADPAQMPKLGCLANEDAYIKDANGNYAYDEYTGHPKIDFTKLDYPRPHVGSWTSLPHSSNPTTETSTFMTGISRIPGMNGMSIAHDIFAGATMPEFPILDIVYNVGTIAPFVVMTYDGAGFTVQEMIREVVAQQAAASSHENTTGEVVNPTVPSPADTAVVGANPPAAAEVEMDYTEIRHLYCVDDEGSTKNFLMELTVVDKTKGDIERICRIDQYLESGSWVPLWHAHYQKSFCQERFSDLFVRYVKSNFICYTNEGLRAVPANQSLAILSAQ